MYLFFDTETTGLPKNWGAPITDFQNWPRMVQLAFVTFNEHGQQTEFCDFIIKPDGFTIPEQAANIHRITTERAHAEGKPLMDVLAEFTARLMHAKYLVAHNMNFDERIVGCEYLRSGLGNPIPMKQRLCTMKESTNYCRLPGPRGYKWPKLQELHRKLFFDNFEEAHNAAADINATAKCFWEMKNTGIAFNQIR